MLKVAGTLVPTRANVREREGPKQTGFPEDNLEFSTFGYYLHACSVHTYKEKVLYDLKHSPGPAIHGCLQDSRQCEQHSIHLSISSARDACQLQVVWAFSDLHSQHRHHDDRWAKGQGPRSAAAAAAGDTKAHLSVSYCSPQKEAC